MLFYYFLEMYSGLVISSKKSSKKVKSKKSTKGKAKDINANQTEDIDRYAERIIILEIILEMKKVINQALLKFRIVLKVLNIL